MLILLVHNFCHLLLINRIINQIKKTLITSSRLALQVNCNVQACKIFPQRFKFTATVAEKQYFNTISFDNDSHL